MKSGENINTILLVKRGAISDAAARELRSAGFRVIFAKKPGDVRVFDSKSDCASRKAKVDAFEYALDTHTSFTMTKDELRRFYIHYLKRNGGY